MKKSTQNNTKDKIIKNKGPLKVVEKYVIQAMLHEKASVTKIAEQIGRSETAVKKYMDELDKVHDTVVKAQIESAKQSKDVVHGESYKTISVETPNKRRVAIMTQGASEHGDEIRKKVVSPAITEAIFVPRPNEKVHG